MFYFKLKRGVSLLDVLVVSLLERFWKCVVHNICVYTHTYVFAQGKSSVACLISLIPIF